MKTQIRFYIILLISALLAISAAASEEKENTTYIYARSVICSAEGTFSGFDLPSDSIPLSDESEKPETFGAQDTSFVGLEGTSYPRSVMASDAPRLDISFKTLSDGTETNVDAKDDADSEKAGMTVSGTVAMGVYVQSNSRDVPSGNVPVELSIIGSDSTVYTCCLNIPIGVPAVVYADTSDLDADFKVQSITLSLLRTEQLSENVSVITTPPVSTETESFNFQKNGGYMWLSVTNGIVSFSDDRLVLSTDVGDVSLMAVPEKLNNSETDSPRRVYCAVGCSEGDGIVDAVPAGEDASNISSHSLSPDGGTALIRLSLTEGSQIIFDFKSGSEKALTVDEFAFYPTDETDSAFYQTITNLTLSDGTLTAQGKISGNIVSTYPKESLGLYMISATGDGDPVLLQKIGITSRFTFSVSMENYPHAAADSLFYVAVTDDSGEVLPVSQPRFVAAQAAKVPSDSLLGLHGANPISVYESGAPHIMIDVDLARLISVSSASNTTVSRGKFIFGINTEYLRELDSDMNFYRSSGIDVYLRMVSTSDIRSPLDGSWLTYQGLHEDEVMLNANVSQSAAMYMAATSFLCQRYPHISSIVISSGVNSKVLTGISYSDLYECASDIALIAHLVYGAAAEVSQDITISIPFVDDSDSANASPEVLASLIAERLSSIGNIPWSLMYYSNGDAPLTSAENILGTIRTNGLTPPSFTTVVWTPTVGDRAVTSSYKKFCDACEITSVKIVFLSVDGMDEPLTREAFSGLKKEMRSSDTVLIDSSPLLYSEVYDGTITGTFTLWDFTDTYSPEGWTPGYGISSLMSSRKNSDPTSGNSGRVLRCITQGGEASPAGMLLCSPKTSLDLSSSPLVEFVFSCSAASDVQIIFVFGNSMGRAEFSCTDTSQYIEDGSIRAVCDLEGFTPSSDIGYVGIIIYSASPVTFELSRVNVLSRTASADEIPALIYPMTDETAEESLSVVKIILSAFAVLVVMVISLKIVSLLKKRDVAHIAEAKPIKRRKF